MRSSVAAIVREIQPESLPDLFEAFDLNSPTLFIEPEQEEHWKDFVHSAPMMGLSELTVLVGIYAYEMQTRDRIIVDSVKLVKQILSSEVLAAIVACWILRDPESFPETVKGQKRLSYHFLAFLHGLKQTSDEEHDKAFRTVFVFLIEHLAGLGNGKGATLGVQKLTRTLTRWGAQPERGVRVFLGCYKLGSNPGYLLGFWLKIARKALQ
ncbi:hypothetical protein K525DRAFT_274868 [Schizophyllum commune Loenen D]|nr:hypothetical protein K525DRAFT_274868 [Schizophyllum commune Loenen D]